MLWNIIFAVTSVLSSVYMFIDGMVWLGVLDILVAGGFVAAAVLHYLDVE